MLLFCISAFWWKESWFNFLPTTAQSFDLSGVQGLKKVDLKLYSTLLKYFNKSNNSKTSWIHIRVGWGGGWGWGGLQQSESFLQNCQESCQYKPKRCTHPPKMVENLSDPPLGFLTCMQLCMMSHFLTNNPLLIQIKVII